MDHRPLGHSGLNVPALGFGAGTFGGEGPLFSAWGRTDVDEARSLVDLCLEHGVSLFDTADVYSGGRSESILGAALQGRRHHALISTKVGLRSGDGPNDIGASRHHLRDAVHAALRRLQTDHIDLLQLHAFDAQTPVDSVVRTLDDLVREGHLRHWGVSNYAGWQLAQALAAADHTGRERPVAHQVYYSLIGRDYEWELMPLGQAEGVGAIVWSPLGWGRLTGRLRRDQPLPEGSRLHATARWAPPVDDDRLFRVIDAMDQVAEETGRTLPQIALNWLLQRPTVSSVLIGARNAAQLTQNLGALGWQLNADQRSRLDAASAVTPPYPYYPYWNGQFAERSPAPVPTGSAV